MGGNDSRKLSILEKNLRKYICLKNGHCYYVRPAENGEPHLVDFHNHEEVEIYFDEEDIDHIADEICVSIEVE